MNLRRATPDDAKALARVHIDSWRAAYRGLVADSFLDCLDYERRTIRFRESLSASADETYLAEEQDAVLGILTLGACRDEDVDPEATGEIWGIYLAPDHWRKGVGRWMCQFAEQLLDSRGYTVVMLWVFEGNQSARRFYEAMGFKADEESKMLNPGTPLKAIRYRRRIKGI